MSLNREQREKDQQNDYGDMQERTLDYETLRGINSAHSILSYLFPELSIDAYPELTGRVRDIAHEKNQNRYNPNYNFDDLSQKPESI